MHCFTHCIRVDDHGVSNLRGVGLRHGLAVRLWPDLAECSCPNDSVA